MSWPGLPTWKMHNPSTYVVERDLRELPDQLARRYASELQQWRRRDQKQKQRRRWLSPVQMAILAVHGLYRGLRAGELGCGLQVSAEGWARQLGCKPRAVTKAFARLKKLGLLERWRRLIPHQWKDGKAARTRADVHGISYLTAAGVKWLAEHAGKTRRLVVQSTWAPGGVRRRVVVAAGLVGKLLETLRSKLKRLALRLSPLAKQDRPEAEDRDERLKTERRSAPRGRAVGSLDDRPPVRLGAARAGMGAGFDRAELQRLRDLFNAGRLTPWDAWPDQWGPPLKKFQPRTSRHGWLETECEKWIEFFEVETNATERRQPEFRHRPDDPRPRRGRWELRLSSAVNQPARAAADLPAPATDVHNWSEYE